MPATRTANRRTSLRRDLGLLVVVCVIPAALVSALLAFSTYKLQRQNVEQQTTLVAQAVLSDLEREIASIESALKTLATSDELASADFKSFHQRARDALGPGIVYNYVLTDPQGRQILNTLQPYGAALPTTGTPPQLARVFSDKVPVLTDMFIGPVTRMPVLAMGVPVGAGNGVAYSLNVGIEPRRIGDIVARQPLPDGWLVAVLDSSGTIVARSRDADRFVGQKAVPEVLAAIEKMRNGRIESLTKEDVPVVTAFMTSIPLRWTVVVGAPKSELQSEVYTQMLGIALAILLAIGAGLFLARRISLRVLSVVDQLSEAAVSLGRGEEVSLPAMELQEAKAVGDAMEQAGQAMKKVRFLAQHDALTELPNRLLFDEVAQRNMAAAQRSGQPMALLAVDLDGFKAVNDTMGHAAGDLVLKEVARRLLGAIRASDIAARIGGDEFFVVLTGMHRESAMEIAQRLVGLLSQPYPDVSLALSASIGVAMYPEHGDSVAVLAASADLALYSAKDSGKARAVMAQVL